MVALPTVFVGDVFTTNKCGDVRVVAYNHFGDVTVEFEDGNRKRTSVLQLRSGTVKNVFHPSLYDVGYLGIEWNSYPGGNMGRTPEYKAWADMLRRCYDEKSLVKHPTYRGCSVSKDWHCFSRFASWYKAQIGYSEGWFLDKDLKVMGNKTYSESTCTLVPRSINNVLTSREICRGKTPIGVYYDPVKNRYIARVGEGQNNYVGTYLTASAAFDSYKLRKEAHVKFLANQYKSSLPPAVYENLINFTVSITD